MLTVFLLCSSSSRWCSVHLASLTLACQVSLVCDTRESWHARLHGASTRAPEDQKTQILPKVPKQTKSDKSNRWIFNSHGAVVWHSGSSVLPFWQFYLVHLAVLSCYPSRSLLALLAVLSCSSCSSSNSAVWFRICQAFELVWRGGG